jgi:hypothetical protein
MRTRGRPHKFTHDTVEAILLSVRAGLSYKTAAEAAGITYETFNQWQKGEVPRGKNKAERTEIDELFSYFSEGLTQARAKGISVLHLRINEASKKDWRAALALLERIDPETYGKRHIEVNATHTMTVEHRYLAERIAREEGLPLEEVMAEAEEILLGDR